MKVKVKETRTSYSAPGVKKWVRGRESFMDSVEAEKLAEDGIVKIIKVDSEWAMAGLHSVGLSEAVCVKGSEAWAAASAAGVKVSEAKAKKAKKGE